MLKGILDGAGGYHSTTENAMGKPLIMSAIVSFTLACGPEAGDGDDIPGKLEYEQQEERLHRLDRRVDVSFEYPGEDRVRWECGLLTDRAYDELEGTLAALDPGVDYGYDPDVLECERPGALVHIEGFDHSPFECSYACCHSDLHWAAVVYSMILNNFSGIYPTIGIAGDEGEPYVAIEPDLPCP